MKRLVGLIGLAVFITGCASDGPEVSPRATLPPDTGQTGIGGPGTGGSGTSGAGMSGIGVDRQRTTGTGTLTNRTDLPR
jgi:hypothetical protein